MCVGVGGWAVVAAAAAAVAVVAMGSCVCVCVEYVHIIRPYCT